MSIVFPFSLPREWLRTSRSLTELTVLNWPRAPNTTYCGGRVLIVNLKTQVLMIYE